MNAEVLCETHPDGDCTYALALGVSGAIERFKERFLAARGEPLMEPPADCSLPEHLRGDGPCTDCGTVDNIVWFTDSVFWNAVIRRGDYVEPILCIPCFVKRTDAAGYVAAWRLTPEFHWETHDERAARKDRSPDPGPAPVRCRLCPGSPHYAAEDYEGHVTAAHGPSRSPSTESETP